MKTFASGIEAASRSRPRPAPTAARATWLLLVLLALAGCSTLPLLYNRGPTLVHWWFDSYLDLNAAQQATLRADLRDWFRWHRATQLPSYADTLAALAREAPGTLAAARVCAINDEIRARLRVGVRHGLPALAKLAISLDADQRQLLAERYAESNAELREEALDGTPAARRQRNAKEAIGVAKDLYGRLDRRQKALIEARMDASPYAPERWLAERAARQRDTLATLEAIAALPAVGREGAARELLAGLVARYGSSPRQEYRAYYAALADYNCAFIADVHNSMNAQQRAKAAVKLASWEADLRALAAAAN